MIKNFKHIILILILLIILGIEQALGLPSIFVIFVLFLAQNYKGYRQLIFLILVGLSLSIFYELPLSLFVIIMLFGQLIILGLASKIKSEGARILLVSLFILIFFLFQISFSFSWLFIIFYNLSVLTAIVIVLFLFRRRRKTLSLSKRVA